MEWQSQADFCCWMKHICFLVGSSNVEFLFEILHMEEHCFGFIGYRCNWERNGLNDIGEDGFERFSGFK